MSHGKLKHDIEEFGFAKAEGVISPLQLSEAERLMDELMFGSGPAISRMRKEMDAGGPNDRLHQPELVRPALISADLRRSNVFMHCKALAQMLFSGQAHYQFDHAIYKMANSRSETPWHQDQAYLGEHVVIPSLHFWIPFQSTSALNGTMQFVSTRQTRLLPHAPASAANPQVLGLQSPIDALPISVMDMQQGDISIHTSLTPHHTGPNYSKNVRKAWIIHFGPDRAWKKHWKQLVSKIM